MLITLLTLAVTQAATPASAQAPVKDKVVCKSVQEAHSRIPSRICRTTTQWAQIEKATEEDLRRSGNQRGVGYNAPPSD